MIWATVNSQSCFCILYGASSSPSVKNIINLISVLAVRWHRVFSCVVGRRCLLWPVHSLGKTLLAFALFHFVLQGHTCLLFHVSLDFVLLHSSPMWRKGHLFWMLFLEGLVGLSGDVWLKLLWHEWLGHIGLLWYWMVYLGNKPRSFCCFWDCTQVLHFGLLLTMRAISFLLRDSCPQ